MNTRILSQHNIFYLFFILVLLVGSCAKINSPTGGPVDRTPPKVVETIPVKGAKNFRGKRITITFDEYVALDNINEKFMVSPPIRTKPKVYLKGKSVITDFDEPLRDSTTYTFYFQDAIKDLNAGNKIDNYQFVLSTGPVIDSLSVTGNVGYSSNLEVPEKTMVLMYANLADSAVVKTIPDYISRIDQTGYFRIDNVKPGKYRLYALKDQDNSRNYNLPDEEFAFLDSAINITPEKNFIPVKKDTVPVKKVETKPIQPQRKETTAGKKKEEKVVLPPVLKGEYQLYMFAALKKSHYLGSSARPSKYMLSYTLSLPPDSMKFDFSIPGAKPDKYIIERSRNRDSMKVWLTDSSLYNRPTDSTLVKYPFTDSLKKIVYKTDTIPMRFVMPRSFKGGKVKKAKYGLGSNIGTGFLKPGQNIVFISETPFRQADTSKIHIYDITDKEKKLNKYSLERDTINSGRYVMNSVITLGKKYLLIADSAAFGNIYNESNDSTAFKFSLKDPESYSSLTLNISNYKGERIIQLLDKSEKIVREVFMNKDGKVLFSLLENGNYRIRVIYDLNGDKKWTTGDFNSGRQPEPVSYYATELEMKPNWNLEQDWDIGVRNIKDQKLKQQKLDPGKH